MEFGRPGPLVYIPQMHRMDMSMTCSPNTQAFSGFFARRRSGKRRGSFYGETLGNPQRSEQYGPDDAATWPAAVDHPWSIP